MHSATHAWDPLPSYVALAVIETVVKENLIQKSKENGQYLKAGFRRLAEKHPLIGDIRGRGMLQGIELVKDRTTREPAVEESIKVNNLCLEKGLVIRHNGTHPNRCTLGFSPHLDISRQEIDEGLDILDEALGEVESMR
jgi:2,2-dialkylglycine decarboxylase (pyruvate)